jgi:hypothetical protein
MNTLTTFTTNVIKKEYITEGVSPFSFSRLTQGEKNEILAERVLNELTSISTNNLIEANLKDPLYIAIANNLNALSKWRDFMIVKDNLTEISKKTNDKVTLDKINTVIRAHDNLIKYSHLIEKSIKEEATMSNNSRIKVAYFSDMVYLIFTVGSALCAESILLVKGKNAVASKVNYTVTIKKIDKSFMQNSISMLHYFNEMCITGKISTFVKTPSAELASYDKSKLNEGVIMDFIMSVVAKQPVLEILLTPIYIIRGFVFFAYYLSTLVSDIIKSNTQTRNILSGNSIDVKDIDDINKDNETKAYSFDQADKQMGENINSKFNVML